MKSVLLILGTLSILHTWSPIRVEAEPLKRIIALGRQIQVVQDRSVNSPDDERKIVEQKLSLLGIELANAPRKLLGSPELRKVILLFILSGGDTRPLRVDIENLDLGSPSGKILRGALAYVEGRVNEARRLLTGIDPLNEESVVGAHLALAQAALSAEEDESVRIDKFAVSRLLLPGSIAEETALRRSVDAAMSVRRYKDAMFFIQQYRRRFPRSIYVPKFQGVQKGYLLRIITDGTDNDAGHACRLLGDTNQAERGKEFVSITKTGLLGDADKLKRLGNCLMDIAVSPRDKALALVLTMANQNNISEDDGGPSISDADKNHLTDEEYALLLSINYVNIMNRREGMRQPNNVDHRPEGDRDVHDEIIDLAEKTLQNVRREQGKN